MIRLLRKYACEGRSGLLSGASLLKMSPESWRTALQKVYRKKTTCLAVSLCIFFSLCLFPSGSHAVISSQKIKVLILDDSHTVIPDKDEKMTSLGNMKGDLLVNGTRYTGNIEVWKGDKGLYLINELSLEDYVESVVASEVGTNWEIEALKAQAVIARTYAVYRMGMNESARFHLTSSVLHQVYKGNNAQVQISYAVKETGGEILTYNGKPIEALYHSTSSGMTEDAEEVFGKSYPYLKPVETFCEQSPYWVWERKIPLAEVEKALNSRGVKAITINSRTVTGRVKDLTVESEEGKRIIKATEFRKLLGWSRLPSTSFKLAMNGDSVTFEGSGYGHGVGLCQWSALQMAKDGKTYREILSYFYPGTEIRLYEGD
ncbi:MAG TPA: SpoIID/LytB domain-containing protein [Thermodesulfovibrionales bacterium]|nr:SpoIID/LytB domain-containing protein [Thermodesulfovibrionales bacterium]